MKDKEVIKRIIKDWLLFTVIFTIINFLFIKHDGIIINLLHALVVSIIYLIILIFKKFRKNG
jgi:hypothetical protein